MKISKFTLSFIIVGIVFLILRFGIYPPIPSSLLYFYLVIAIFAVLIYISAGNQSLGEFFRPIKDTIVNPEKRGLRISVFAGLPILVASLTYVNRSGEAPPPAELRSIHPAPPSQIQFRGKSINLDGAENPFRKDKANFRKYVEEGAVIYFKNCFFCHGDNLDGKGHFAKALNPMPANFVDKGTIAQLQESFVFWRISKGGPGLPNEGTPWNSAMPAWETILSEDEIWKVILYIYDGAGVEPRTWEEHSSEPDAHQSTPHEPASTGKSPETTTPGEALYMKKCQYCHGPKGKGDGPAAEFVDPRPRDLTKARYKIKSTPGGELPTNDDVRNVIANGIHGTSMPPWSVLGESNVRALADHVKTLAKRFRKYKERGKPLPDPIKVGTPLPITQDSINKGRELFTKLECWKCHGKNGRGNGPNALTLKDDWKHPIKPANLWRYWDFKGGYDVVDIYKTITTGRAGTPMPSFVDSATDEERWHIANFVKSLGPTDIPAKATVLKSHFTNGALPATCDDPIWDTVKTSEFSLFGQILIEPKLFTPAISAINVKSVFNDENVAFLLEWDDITQSVSGETESGAAILPDAAAIQFPVKLPESTSSQKPYFFMGDKKTSVNLWKWDAKDGFNELNANGSDDVKIQDKSGADIKASQLFDDGRRKLLITRTLLTSDKDKDIQFEINKFTPIALHLWEGHNNESGQRAAISTWANLLLEKNETGKNIIYAILTGLTIFVIELIVIWRVVGSSLQTSFVTLLEKLENIG